MLASWLMAIGVLVLVAPHAVGQDGAPGTPRHRVLICTDIGGSDPDDFQSLIHYLTYADRFDTEGLIASPPDAGRKEHILRIVDLYAKDYPKFKRHADAFPTPDFLRSIAKQGATERAPGKGWSRPTEGSRWIVACARKPDPRPLWILVWGGIDDVAQALHDDPSIVGKIRVYFIAGPNKKWSADAYVYLATTFPDLWMIENNATYRGWFVGGDQQDDLGNQSFYERHIRGHGALGGDFGKYYGGAIKMGDTPSVAYLLHGNPDDPAGESWGGSFTPMTHSPRRIFARQTTPTDRVPVFGVVEWALAGPDRGPADDRPCLSLAIANQEFEGYAEGGGRYRARFVPKSVGQWSCLIKSRIPELDGRHGAFTSIEPWPGVAGPDDIAPLTHWWTDRPDPDLFEGPHQGARTVSRWRADFLRDWARRLDWLAEE
jgi:hypothetical protein